MAVKELSIANLPNLDYGKVSMAFAHHLKRVALDCADRPIEKKARAVTLQLAVVPCPNDDGSCDSVKIQMTVSSTVPKHRTKVYDLGLRAGGQLAFNEESADCFEQSALFPEDEGEAEDA